MEQYSYENVKEAYMAIIEVGRANVSGFMGQWKAQRQHTKNLQTLEGASKELYVRLIEDKTINY